MNYYAQFSLSRKGWYVYQETEFGGAFIFSGPYVDGAAAEKRAKELNDGNNSKGHSGRADTRD